LYVDGFYWFSRNLRTKCQGISTQGDVLRILGGGRGREEEHVGQEKRKREKNDSIFIFLFGF
jgi:hypothetical protein